MNVIWKLEISFDILYFCAMQKNLKKMKRILLLFLLASLFAALIPQTCFAEDENTTIILIEQISGSEGSPIVRSPGLIPIEAKYCSKLSTIMLYFHRDLGATLIIFKNVNTGLLSQLAINAVQGAHFLLAPGSVGEYEIVFALTNGCVFFGTFEIV